MASREDTGILKAGTAAPGFQLKELGGGTKSLTDLLQRGPVLLAFFKVSCPVCQLTFPFLERLSKNEDVQVIGVSQDDAGATKGFNDRFHITLPILLDESRAGYPVSNGYGISSVPTMFLIERDGVVSNSTEGFSRREMLRIGERVHVEPFREGEYVPEFKAG